MSADGPIVTLQLESRPQSLTLVRGILTGVAELLEMDAELLDDVKTAVSEACNNVVLHAYGEDVGPLEIALSADQDLLGVVVSDRGAGLPDGAAPSDGIGISIIRALSRRSSLDPRSGGGLEVTMEFDAVRDGLPLFGLPPAATEAAGTTAPALAPEEIGLTLAAPALLAGVLGRVARTLAATAHFSLDRFSDVYMVTDTLAALAERAAVPGPIVAAMSAHERRLRIAIEPFAAGTGAAISASRNAGPLDSPLARLTDEISTEAGSRGERIEVVVVDSRR